MIFGTALLFLMELVSVEVTIYPSRDCDYSVAVLPRQVYAFNSPHFPSAYSAGITCRWIFDCPPEYTCRIQCRDVGLPSTQGCFMDRLLVSRMGNLFFDGAQVFCGKTTVNSTSVGSRITLGLVSGPTSPGGRFRCIAMTEPFAHPWPRFNISIHNIPSKYYKR